VKGIVRILIVGEHAEARQRLAHMLQSDHREIVDAAIEGAAAEIRRQAPRVLLVLLPDVGTPELLRTLSAADKAGGMYVVGVTAEHHQPRMISSAIAAGAHDVLCPPYAAQELSACVDVERRLRRWMSTRMRVIDANAVPTTSVLNDLRAWNYLGDVIADDFESMFNHPLVVVEGWPTFTESIQLAAISMTLAAEQLELCVSIVADSATRRWLGERLLGDSAASELALDDVMRELANIAGGALKRAAGAEGPVLAAGIPIDGRSLPGRDTGARCWTIPLEGSAVLAVIGEVRRRANRRIPATRLTEGMVVVGNVCNSAGVLLLLSGTRLTSTTVARLSNMLDTTLIEVSS
jgi:CheY-like chemotaxis protein